MRINNMVTVTLAATLSLEPMLKQDQSHVHCHPETESPVNIPAGVKVYGNIGFNDRSFHQTECRLVTLMNNL